MPTGTWIQWLFVIWNSFISWIWSLLYSLWTEDWIGCYLIFRCAAVTKPMQIATTDCMRLITWPAVCVCVYLTFATRIIWKDVLMRRMIIVLSWHELHFHSQVIWKFPLSGKFAVICSHQHLVPSGLLIDCNQGLFPFLFFKAFCLVLL